MASLTPAAPLRFGRYELQAQEQRLLVDGVPATIGGRAFDVLVALVQRPGRLVTKRELMDIVWPDVVVDENNLAAQVSALRKIVGGEVIATIPGRGYRFVAPLEPASPAAADAASGPDGDVSQRLRTNLPVELPALLGRDAELAEIDALIERHRLVSIVGAGGMGKSLLAEHVLHARRTAYPHGVCWVELADGGESNALPGALATALGVHIGHGEPLAALLGALAPLTLLLAIDNAEHRLADVAHLCQALHDAAPGVRMLVTSQAPLGRPVERVFRLGPLSLPDGEPSARDATRFGALALFAERAHAVDGRFAIDDANAATVAAVCRALDGAPLAIELAAARAPLLGLPRLLASMQDRLRLLTSNRNRAAPDRQQTLRSALDWSHDLLGARERTVFRRLAVIAGSASLELIEQFAADGDGPGLDAWAVLDALDVLVDRSLVVLQPGDGDDRRGSGAGAAPRYRLLESPHAYALDKLVASGELDTVRARLARALAARFDAEYDAYFSGSIGAEAWMHRLESDLDNAREALAWARSAGDAALEITLAATLLRALSPSLHAERMTLADAVEARLAASGARLSPALLLRAWIELSCAWADTQKARGRDAAGQALQLARALAAAPSGLAEAEARDGARATGDADRRFTLYHALCRVVGAAAQAGDVEAARAPLAELQALEDPSWPAQRRLWGEEAAQIVARIGGDAAEALHRSRRLLALDQARGGQASIPLGNLIDSELAAGDAAGAARSGAAHVAALEGTRDEYSLAYARLNLCAALLALGDSAAARPVARAAWPQSRAFEMQHYAAGYFALLAALERRPRAAASLLGYAEALFVARAEVREKNEEIAMTRARELALAALDGAAFEQARRAGASLRDDGIAAIAFGERDGGDEPATGSAPEGRLQVKYN